MVHYICCVIRVVVNFVLNFQIFITMATRVHLRYILITLLNCLTSKPPVCCKNLNTLNLCVCLSLCVSVCVSIFLYVCLSVCLSVSVSLYVCLSVCMVVVMCDISFVNSVHVINQNPRVTAINSCIEVDLTGQVCADSIGTRMYSGISLSLSVCLSL